MSNIEWGTGINNEGKTKFGDASAKAESLTEENVKEFAESLDSYLQNAQTMEAGTADEDGKVVYTLGNFEPGYYLIKDKDNTQEEENGTYTAYMLKVVENVTATPKDSVPTVDKSVNGDGINAADVNIGDTVTFTLKATLGDNIDEFTKYKVVFHDTMSAGLTFQEYVSATLEDEVVTDYFSMRQEGNALTFTCADVKALGATEGSVITITYTAILNNNAKIGTAGNSNKVYLEYSNDPTHSGEGEPTGNTPEDEVLVFTYELEVKKVDGKDNTTALKDAEFILYRENSDGTKEYVQANSSGKVTDWVTDKESASALVSDENGLFRVIGLDAGIYWLEETKAPAGYNLLKDPVKVVITATLNTAEDSASLETLEITVGIGEDAVTAKGNKDTGIVKTTVENNAGSTLPETGGMGTTIFYIAGGALVLVAVVLLVTKRRMRAE